MRTLLSLLFIFLFSAFALADSGKTLVDKSVTVINGNIELNHFYDDSGKWVFDQYIFYSFNYDTLRFDVIEWKMIKDGRKKLSNEEIAELKEKNKQRLLNEWGLKKWPVGVGVPYEPEYGHSKTFRLEKKNDRVYLYFDMNGIDNVIIANGFNESWTQYDPELVEREYIPKEKRRGLNHSPIPTPEPKPKTKVETTMSFWMNLNWRKL